MIILSFFLVLLSCLSYLFCQAKEANKKIKKDPLRPHGQKGKNKMSNLVDEVNKEMADTMKRLPGNLLRLIRTIQQIEEWNERYKTNFYKDNFEEIKNKLLQTQKEYDDIYDKLYKSGDFKVVCPETYENTKRWLMEDVIDYPNSCIDFIQRSLNYNDSLTEKERLFLHNKDDIDLVFRDVFHGTEWLGYNDTFTFEYSQEYAYPCLSEVIQLCSKYFSEEYEGDFETEFIDESGNFDFEKFCDETEFREDIAKPFYQQIIQEYDITERIEQVNKEIINDFEERMKTKNQISKPAPSFDDDWER